MPSCRNYCFTSWYPPVDWDVKNTSIKYLIYGIEICPETGTQHYQGYVEFFNQISMTNMKLVFCDNTMHIERRYGTQEEAINYCMKDGYYYEYGIPALQGERTDITEAISSSKDVYDIMDNYPSLYIRYPRGLDKIMKHKVDKSIPDFRPMETVCYIGPPGTGKTHKAITENTGKYYILESTGGNIPWFDGYKGEKVLIIDEFYGWLKYNQLLRITDKWKTKVQIKGDFVWAQWEKVIIISNKDVDQWYNFDMSALHSRIKEIIYFGGVDKRKNNKTVCVSSDVCVSVSEHDINVPSSFHISTDYYFDD